VLVILARLQSDRANLYAPPPHLFCSVPARLPFFVMRGLRFNARVTSFAMSASTFTAAMAAHSRPM
jgi:uncharacterized membrane protein YjgN (DUF898 family)